MQANTREDPRKTALKMELDQLLSQDLKRLIAHVALGKPVLLDEREGHANPADGVYCPLAIAIDAPALFRNYGKKPTDTEVFEYLADLGFKIYNTCGVHGDFYTHNRRADLLVAAREVLAGRNAYEKRV